MNYLTGNDEMTGKTETNVCIDNLDLNPAP